MKPEEKKKFIDWESNLINVNNDNFIDDISTIQTFCKINDDNIMVDCLMKNIIKVLNKNGYKIIGCCSGHKEDMYSNSYIRIDSESMSDQQFLNLIKATHKARLIFNHNYTIITHESDKFKECFINIVNPSTDNIHQIENICIKHPDIDFFNKFDSSVVVEEHIDIKRYKISTKYLCNINNEKEQKFLLRYNYLRTMLSWYKFMKELLGYEIMCQI